MTNDGEDRTDRRVITIRWLPIRRSLSQSVGWHHYDFISGTLPVLFKWEYACRIPYRSWSWGDAAIPSQRRVIGSEKLDSQIVCVFIDISAGFHGLSYFPALGVKFGVSWHDFWSFEGCRWEAPERTTPAAIPQRLASVCLPLHFSIICFELQIS